MDDEKEIRDAVFEAIEVSLEAQLKAVRRLRAGASPAEPAPAKSRSNTDLAYDILRGAGEPLHVSEILRRMEQDHGVRVDRESLVSALSKKVVRKDRFVRVGKNTFGLRGDLA